MHGWKPSRVQHAKANCVVFVSSGLSRGNNHVTDMNTHAHRIKYHTYIWLISQSFSLSKQTVPRINSFLMHALGHTEANTLLVIHKMDTIKDFNADGR